MADTALRPLLTAVANAVAGAVAALEERVAVDRTVETWDLDDDGPYAEVSAATPATAALAGDSTTLGWVARVQVDLWERTAAEDPDLVDLIVGALNGVAVGDPAQRTWRGRVLSAGRIPEPAADVTHSVVEVRYSLPR